MAKNEFKPDYALAPGAIIDEHMEHHSISKRQLAEHLGVSKKTVKKLLKGKAPITQPIAEGLATIFTFPVHMWINLEAGFQKDVKRLGKKAIIW